MVDILLFFWSEQQQQQQPEIDGTFCAIMQQRARSGFETCDQLLLLRSRPPTRKRFRGKLLSLVFIDVASYTSNLKCVAWFAD